MRQAGVAESDEAPWSDAVGHIAKLIRPQLREIAQHGLLQKPRVQFGDAVDLVAADAREVCHADVARSAFIDDGEPRESFLISRECGAHVLEEASINLEDDLEMPRKQRAEEIDRPFFQRLGE